MARKINLNRQLLGLEDLLFGEGTETQTRGGQEVIISKINIGNLPFNETQTLLEWLNSTDITTLISSIPELLSIYENLPMLSELDTSTTEIIEAINKYLGLSVTINTLNSGVQATASYNSLTGILTLGIPKGDIGPKGPKGDIGPKGNSIESVIKTSGNSAPGTTDIYTITFTDLSTSNFTVYNGANGAGSGDMHTSIYDANSNGIVDNAQMLSLDLTNTTPPNTGQIKWNQDEGTADLGLYGAVLQIGQEFLIRVRASSNLTNGTVVMASGSIGNSGIIVVTAHDGTQANATSVLGVLTEDIEAGADGFATIIGKVRNINTTGTLVGESWVDGDKLYVKPSDSGKLTKIEPLDTEIKMSVAYVIKAHSNGTLYVRVTGFDENHYKNWVTTLLNTKVDKVEGKGLSTEDYTNTEKAKLDAIAENANNYSHPANHSPSIITQDSNNRFVSDTEKASWNAKLDASSGVPIGTVIDFASPTAPAGYLKCNGALISRSTYSALFSVIGTTYGEGNGSTTFALPDRRGYFARGWDDGRGIDVVPIASWSYSGTTITINTTGNHGVTVGQTVTLSGLVSTTNAPNGDITVVTAATAKSFTFTATATPTGTATVSSAKVSRTFGSSQADGYLNHSHTGSTGTDGAHSHSVLYNGASSTINLSISGNTGSGAVSATPPANGAHSHTVTVATSTTGATETRPKNIASLYCIKY